VPFAAEYDEATRLARNATFAEHWGSTEQSPAAWRHLVTGSGAFQPELSFLLLGPGDEVMAFVLSAFFEADAMATGVRELHITSVGTRREWRGRGVATALLAHTITQARARGFQRASLGVDVDNVNRALGVYERCGFSESQRWFGWVLAVQPRP
jgi:mycothiol synthase